MIDWNKPIEAFIDGQWNSVKLVDYGKHKAIVELDGCEFVVDIDKLRNTPEHPPLPAILADGQLVEHEPGWYRVGNGKLSTVVACRDPREAIETWNDYHTRIDPAPWVKVSERLPTEEDSDSYGEVEWKSAGARMRVGWWNDECFRKTYTHWRRIVGPKAVQNENQTRAH